jgi:hypothetical protein
MYASRKVNKLFLLFCLLLAQNIYTFTCGEKNAGDGSFGRRKEMALAKKW